MTTNLVVLCNYMNELKKTERAKSLRFFARCYIPNLSQIGDIFFVDFTAASSDAQGDLEAEIMLILSYEPSSFH